MMDILFLGTPAFACPSLSALVEAGHRIVGVVTRTDKPRGRSGKAVPSDVKRAAQQLGLTVLETEKASAPDFVARLAGLKPQIGVVVAFGELLSNRLLAVPQHGFINGHASLLPKYRGAAPITWAVVNGERQTGITVIRLVKKMDAGPIVLQRATDIGPDETAGGLHDRLSDLCAEVLVEAVAAVEAGAARFTPQDDASATFAPTLKKTDGQVPWDRTPSEINRFVRGMTPWPGAYSFLERQDAQKVDRIAILKVRAAGGESSGVSPGAVIALREGRLLVAARDGAVLVERLKPAGGKEMSPDEYARGRPVKPGDLFRSESRPAG